MHFEDEEEELEIELNEDEPAFLRGQTTQTTDLSPSKVVTNPDGSLQRAALTQVRAWIHTRIHTHVRARSHTRAHGHTR